MTGENIRAHAQAGDWGGHADAAFWHNDFKMVKKIIDDMDVVQVESAARIYEQVSKSVESTMWMLHSEARRLRENWAGEDADAAMEQMQKAYTAAGELYQVSKQTSGALAQYAQHQRDWQSQVGGTLAGIAGSDLGTVTQMTSPISGVMNNDNADQLMDKIQQDTVAANNRFPAGIGVDMPYAKRGGVHPTSTNPGDGGGPGIAPVPSDGSLGQPPDSAGAGHPRHGGQLPGGDLPGGGGTDLAGYTPPGGGGAGGLGGGLGAGGLGGGGAGTGGLGSGAGGGPGAGGIVGGFPGAGAGGTGVGARGTGAAGKPGVGGMGGGMGGGRGGEEEELERTTWLAEDEDIWGGDDDATPPVIG